MSIFELGKRFNFIDTYSPNVDEWARIKEISDRFPEYTPSILSRFRATDLTPQELRPYASLQGIKGEPRRGLLQRGLEAGSVYRHMRLLPVILGKIFRDSAELKERYYAIAKTTPILVHDIGEDLTSDFTPKDSDRISSDEKIWLEDIAMKMIFGPESDRYKAYVDYKDKKTPHDIAIKAADCMEWILDLIKREAPQEFIDEGLMSASETMRHYQELNKNGYKDLWMPFVNRLNQPNGKKLVLEFYLGR